MTSLRTDKRRIGLKAHVKLMKPLPEADVLEMAFFPGGYGGVQPLDSNIANLCMLVTADTGKRLQDGLPALLSQTFDYHERFRLMLDGAELLEDWQTTSNINWHCNLGTPSDGWLRAGDAAVTIAPFTGSGMAIALRTGILAAESLIEGISHQWPHQRIHAHYANRYQRLLGRRLMLTRWFSPLLYSRPAQSLMGPWLAPALPTLARTFR
jgi:flavin-dependent dehydrogenase